MREPLPKNSTTMECKRITLIHAGVREENQKAMDSFRDPRGIPVIVNVEMLTEGFDAPEHTHGVHCPTYG